MVLLETIFREVFFFIVAGFFLGKIKIINLKPFTKPLINLVIYVITPVFMLMSMWEGAGNLADSFKIFIIVCCVMTVNALGALLLARVLKWKFREVCLPVIFMNSGFLAIPLNLVMFSEEVLGEAIVYNTIIGVIIYSIGIGMVVQKSRLKEIIRIPVVYMALIGMLLNYTHVQVPGVLIPFNEILQKITVPAMLFLVGYQLNAIQLGLFKIASIGVLLRMGGGFLAALVIIKTMHITGAVARVGLMSSSMPSGVLTYILAEKYNAKPDFAASMVLLGTVFTMLIIIVIALLSG